MDTSFLFLGTGGSLGTPAIGCACKSCTSSSPQDKRLRTSALVEIDGKKLLIDASPDIRHISLCYNITSVDALLITHGHEDHIGGMNDLRPYYTLREYTPLPLFTSEHAYQIIHRRFSYAIDRFLPHFLPTTEGELSFAGVQITYFSYHQLDMPVTGYRIGPIAYITDIKEYPTSIFSHLQNLDTLVLGVIHEKGAPMHFSLAEALAFIEKVSPKRTFFTHISHDIDRESFSRKLPPNVEIAYDGLKLTWPAHSLNK
ncbi:MAG: MBL fold metallo-hydrolase [Verrucomicrobia bacterium]|nr:MBL fold metallo-hydrolase [Verrucomicrobiota bacterium]